MPHVEGVRHHDVIVRGMRFHVAEAGEGDPVVLLHGWPQHWWEWRHQIPALAERYRVICPDLRGFGWSELPPDDDFRKETLADDVLALLAELGLERVRLVGHDWGGWVGFLVCLRDDHPVERLVVLSVPPPWPPPGGLTAERASRMTYQLPIAAPGPAAMKTRAAEAVLRLARRDGDWASDELETYLEPLRLPGRARASKLLYRSFLLREVAALARGKYAGARLRVPTLYMIGERDALCDEQTPEHLHSRADNVEVEIVPGAAHFLPEERPDLVRDRLLEFLERPNGNEPRMETTKGPGEPDREGFVSQEAEEGDDPQVHTRPGEGHPAGDGERSDRDIGGPTAPDDEPDEDVPGGAPGTKPGSGFESH